MNLYVILWILHNIKNTMMVKMKMIIMIMITIIWAYREHLPTKEEANKAKCTNFGCLASWRLFLINLMIIWSKWQLFLMMLEISGLPSLFLTPVGLWLIHINFSLQFSDRTGTYKYLPFSPVSNSVQHGVLLHSPWSVLTSALTIKMWNWWKLSGWWL